MKHFFLFIITLAVLVTCCNVQAIRDEYAPDPSPIEEFFVGTLSKLVSDERGGSDAY